MTELFEQINSRQKNLYKDLTSFLNKESIEPTIKFIPWQYPTLPGTAHMYSKTFLSISLPPSFVKKSV